MAPFSSKVSWQPSEEWIVCGEQIMRVQTCCALPGWASVTEMPPRRCLGCGREVGGRFRQREEWIRLTRIQARKTNCFSFVFITGKVNKYMAVWTPDPQNHILILCSGCFVILGLSLLKSRGWSEFRNVYPFSRFLIIHTGLIVQVICDPQLTGFILLAPVFPFSNSYIGNKFYPKKSAFVTSLLSDTEHVKIYHEVKISPKAEG